MDYRGEAKYFNPTGLCPCTEIVLCSVLDHLTVALIMRRSVHLISCLHFTEEMPGWQLQAASVFFFVHCMIVYGTPFCLPRGLGSINIFARDDSHNHLQQLRSRSHSVSGFERVIYLDISIAKTLVRFRPVYARNDFLHGFFCCAQVCL